MAKVSPEVCWFGLGEALELVYVCETGRGGAQKHSMWDFLQSPQPFELLEPEYSGITAVA